MTIINTTLVGDKINLFNTCIQKYKTNFIIYKYDSIL